MELGTTSAVITFAIELNEKAQANYAQAQKATDNTKLLEAIQVMQKLHSKRKKRLHRFRRELVTEMILEPIHGFNSEDFTLDIQITPGTPHAEIIVFLLTNEENMKNYLLTASKKLDFLRELSDQFQLLAEDLERNIQLIKEIQ
jgi:hypothetical protein